MNPEAWNLRGYTGFVWGACAWLVFIWAYFRLPVSTPSGSERLRFSNKHYRRLKAEHSTSSMSSLRNKFPLASSLQRTSMLSMKPRTIALLSVTRSPANLLHVPASFRPSPTFSPLMAVQKTQLLNADHQWQVLTTLAALLSLRLSPSISRITRFLKSGEAQPVVWLLLDCIVSRLA